MSRPAGARVGPPRRNLQRRLAFTYGATVFGVGLVVLAIPYVAGRASSVVPLVVFGRGAGFPGRRALLVAQRGADVHQQLALSLVALLVLAVIAVVAGSVLAGRTLRPLREITDTAQEISASNLHRRLDIDGPYDELNELASTLDELLARLEASFAAQRNFVANASHELRTPLTAERALLQVALADPDASAESLRAVCQEVVALGDSEERLIDDLLTLAQSEGGVQESERFDLSLLARSSVQARAADAAERQVEVEASCVPAPVTGDRRLVAILVGNLVDNAVRHNQPGGHVLVRTAHSGRGSTVAVANSGPVVADQDVAHLCEPFMRLDSTRRLHGEGHGLGLAIVRAVADAHRAELRIRARPEGGLAVEVTFPPVRSGG